MPLIFTKEDRKSRKCRYKAEITKEYPLSVLHKAEALCCKEKYRQYPSGLKEFFCCCLLYPFEHLVCYHKEQRVEYERLSVEEPVGSIEGLPCDVKCIYQEYCIYTREDEAVSLFLLLLGTCRYEEKRTEICDEYADKYIRKVIA